MDINAEKGMEVLRCYRAACRRIDQLNRRRGRKPTSPQIEQQLDDAIQDATQRRLRIQNTLSKMGDDRYKEVIELLYIDGHIAKRVAMLLHYSESTVSALRVKGAAQFWAKYIETYGDQ